MIDGQETEEKPLELAGTIVPKEGAVTGSIGLKEAADYDLKMVEMIDGQETEERPLKQAGTIDPNGREVNY